MKTLRDNLGVGMKSRGKAERLTFFPFWSSPEKEKVTGGLCCTLLGTV